jgi:heme oxygenase
MGTAPIANETMTGDARAASLLAALRASTAEVHRDLEGLPSMTRLLEPLALEEYLAILRRLWRFHTRQEARLARDELPQAFRQRSNVALLECDLRGTVPARPLERARTSRAESLGVLYVLEGSALGGAVIARHVASVPALAGRTAFFARPPQHVAARWRGFLSLLAEHDAEPAPFRLAVIAGARGAFADAKLALGGD